MATYSFKDVQCTLTGPGGYASLGGDGGGVSDEGITIEPTEDVDTMTTGAAGDIMHSLHAARPANISIRLLKTSPNNAVLSTLFSFQTSSSAFHGRNVIAVSDFVSGDIVTCTQVAFSKHAGVTYSKDGNYNEWTFKGKVTFALGDY